MTKSLWVKIRPFWLQKAQELLCMYSYLHRDERVIHGEKGKKKRCSEVRSE